jgi:Type ISP C-terminal specificity domain
VDLHVLAKPIEVISRYPIAGCDRVDGVRYTAAGAGEALGRIWINATQYFEGISQELWEFRIGGYQVAERWLKDRKGRQLSYDDITHYQQVLAALSGTMTLMESIDEAVEEAGGWPFTGPRATT